MSLLNHIISEQNFEKVRDRIGAILALEVDYQVQENQLDYEPGIWIERTTPVQDSEDLVLNVSVSDLDYSNFNELSSEGNDIFNIDIYCRSKQKPGEDGGYRSNFKCQRVAGWVRYILSHTVYKTLDFDFGFIGGTYINSIAFNNEFLVGSDSLFLSFCRITFLARVFETQNGEIGNPLHVGDSRFYLDETELGYKLESIINE